jgi:hypothetical protein
MSEPLRVAFVGEGPTDMIVVKAALTAILAGRNFILRQLQPEESSTFGPIGTGWVGVHRWCNQAAARAGGRLRDDVLYREYDILILQLDADVAGKTYASGGIQETIGDLPCAQPCPPPSASTNPLRNVLLRWSGETHVPPRTILCTPSKSMEAWVVAAMFPGDQAVRDGIECWSDPENRLGQQPVAQRIQKRKRDYERHAGELTNAWVRLAGDLNEARRFQADCLAAFPATT